MAERTPMPDIIVLIPGILGSVLEKDGKTIWGPNWSAIKGVIPVWGQSLDRMTIVDDDPEHHVRGGVLVVADLLHDLAHVLPFFGSRFYIVEGTSAIGQHRYEFRRAMFDGLDHLLGPIGR